MAWYSGLQSIIHGVGNALGVNNAYLQARAQRDEQRREYNRMVESVRVEQRQMNQRIEASREQAQRGLARANRGRARGGIFGDAGQQQQNQGPLNPRLG